MAIQKHEMNFRFHPTIRYAMSALGGPPRDSPENGPPRQTIGLRTLHLADVHGKPINAAVGAHDLVEHRGERPGVVFF